MFCWIFSDQSKICFLSFEQLKQNIKQINEIDNQKAPTETMSKTSDEILRTLV